MNYKKYFENEDKVLRFKATWNNDMYYFSFFLCNDTVEIRELPDRETSEPFQTLLRRQKIPLINEKNKFLQAEHLICGNKISVFSRYYILFCIKIYFLNLFYFSFYL